jgi:hypothetical protein
MKINKKQQEKLHLDIEKLTLENKSNQTKIHVAL